MLSLSGHIAAFIGLKPEFKRMDGLMIASACKKTAKLEIVRTEVGNMTKAVEKTVERPLLSGLERCLDPSDRNAVIYHCKDDAELRLQKAIDEGTALMGKLGAPTPNSRNAISSPASSAIKPTGTAKPRTARKSTRPASRTRRILTRPTETSRTRDARAIREMSSGRSTGTENP
jgi:hypothetical protein